MTLLGMHDYLKQTRQSLCGVLAEAGEENIGRPIRDLLFHTIAVSDCWLHEDILRTPPLLDRMTELAGVAEDPAGAPLAVLENYWRAVGEATEAYLRTLPEGPAVGGVVPHDDLQTEYPLDGLLWHVLLHEVRHTAQIVLLLRQQGVKPPALDLLFYLPTSGAGRGSSGL